MREIESTSNLNKANYSIIEDIKANDEFVLKSLYATNYSKIEALVLKNSGTKDHAKDIYQDAFLVVWKNIKQDKFVPQNKSSLNGYLYTVAKNKWMDYLRSKDYKRTVISDDFTNLSISDNDTKINDDITNDKRLQDAMTAFRDLGLSCKQLLTKFYFEKKSMREIAAELKLDAASTRNKKYRCMQKLRELALKNDT